MADALERLTVPDRTAWQDWLNRHHDATAGVWLVLAKKGVTVPTSLTYDEALEEALCFGWIDGQLNRLDSTTFLRRFTPRNARSQWSRRNVELVERLTSEGRMTTAGLTEVAQAKADGRWEKAYAGSATIEMPEDLAAALENNPTARQMFERLTRQNRYAVLYRIDTAKRADTRATRIEKFVAMLTRGETIYPQDT